MLYLALGAGALAAWLYFTGGKKPVFRRREWRFGAAVAALVAFTGAAYAGVRGAWEPLVALAVLGLWLASEARKPGAKAASPPSSRMSRGEAARILGVAPDASREEVQAAFTRLMRAVHPDKGGTAGLAAQLNAARETLLGK